MIAQLGGKCSFWEGWKERDAGIQARLQEAKLKRRREGGEGAKKD